MPRAKSTSKSAPKPVPVPADQPSLPFLEAPLSVSDDLQPSAPLPAATPSPTSPPSQPSHSVSSGNGAPAVPASPPVQPASETVQPFPSLPSDDLARICAEIIDTQRQWVNYSRSGIMTMNRLRAVVASDMGYRTHQEPGDRERMFREADALIERVVKDGGGHRLTPMILSTMKMIADLKVTENQFRKALEKWAQELPVAAWARLPAQKGLGFLNLAHIVGETGDLRLYSNPAKVWKRMGCCPWSYKGRTHMGSFWKRGIAGVSLPAEEWKALGYNPRRRSVMFNVADTLIKGNGDGPYRQRYADARLRVHAARPEWADGSPWKVCDKCKDATEESPRCLTCGGSGFKCRPAHFHAYLLVAKLLLKNLWVEWNGNPRGGWDDPEYRRRRQGS